MISNRGEFDPALLDAPFIGLGKSRIVLIIDVGKHLWICVFFAGAVIDTDLFPYFDNVLDQSSQYSVASELTLVDM